jgi:hypothetical protein
LIVQYIVPRLLNSMSFPVPTSLMVLSFHAVGCNRTYLQPRSVYLKISMYPKIVLRLSVL